jgi:Txe/YoeB family toxin of Txe-Axe toxin-antitoxin module
LKNLNYILVCGSLSLILTLAGYVSNQGNEITGTPSSISTPVNITGTPTQSIKKTEKPKGNISTSENNNVTDYDFTSWNEKKLYEFLNKVLEYTHQIALKIYPSKEEILTKYQNYFTPELSVKIVDSLFVKTDRGWKVPDGDGGYIFTVPVKGKDEHSDVVIEIQKMFIKLKATYEIGMYSLIQYTIQYDNKPIITEWIMQ